MCVKECLCIVILFIKLLEKNTWKKNIKNAHWRAFGLQVLNHCKLSIFIGLLFVAKFSNFSFLSLRSPRGWCLSCNSVTKTLDVWKSTFQYGPAGKYVKTIAKIAIFCELLTNLFVSHRHINPLFYNHISIWLPFDS